MLIIKIYLNKANKHISSKFNLFLQEIRFPVIYTVLFMRSPIDFWCKYQIYRGFLSRVYYIFDLVTRS